MSSSGAQANAFSDYGALSGNGRYVAFTSYASNLVAGDTNGAADVFVHDLQTGTTTRVSISSTGTAGDADSLLPTLSSDGRYVAFFSIASNLVGDDTNGLADVFVHDQNTGATTRISLSSAGTEGDGDAAYSPPSISSDGRYVAFASAAANLVDDDANGTDDVFLHDRTTGSTSIVSVNSSGEQAEFASGSPSLSGDGDVVAFWSVASNLGSYDFNGTLDVFVHETATGETTRVSVPASGLETDGGSLEPEISSDARYVAFQSDATNLVASDGNGATDVFIHDLESGTTKLVSVSTAGIQGADGSSEAAISEDGRYVAFTSSASNLVASDTNAKDDVFVHDRGTPPAPPSVVVDEPLADARIFGTQAVAATVLQGFTAERVDFLVDGEVVATDSTEPFEVDWDTTEVADDDHLISAVAVAPDDTTSESDPVPVAIINGATCDEKLDADREAEALDADDYVLSGIYCIFEPSLLDERYAAPGESMDVEGALFHVARFWEDASQATQDDVAEFFADVDAGLYTHPSGGSSPLRLKATPARTAAMDLFGSLDCDLIVNRFSEPVEWCTYVTSDNHFKISYEGLDGDPENDIPSRVATAEDSLRAALAKYTSAAVEEHEDVSSPLGHEFDTEDFPITVTMRPWFFAGFSTAPPPILGGSDIYLDPGASMLSDPRHELFHVIQFNYASLLDYNSRPGTSFWMEATAEWALHQAETPGMGDDREDYADNLAEFLRDPDIDLMAHASWTDTNNHEYGAFLLAEYLEERYGVDFIRRTWERVGDGDGLGAMEAVEDVIETQEEESLAGILPDFWRRAYRLSPSIDAYIDADFLDDDVDLWRNILEEAGSPTAADDHAGARPERHDYALDGTMPALGIMGVQRGGATFSDFLYEAPKGGRLEIELRNLEFAGVDLVPTGEDVSLDLYSFAEYPALCQEPVTDISVSSSGVVSETIPIDNTCTFSTLVVTHANIHGDPKVQVFDVRFVPSVLPLRNDAEGGVDDDPVTELNSGEDSGDPFNWAGGIRAVVEFDDDGPVSNGDLSYKFIPTDAQPIATLAWDLFEEYPPAVTVKFRMRTGAYPSEEASLLVVGTAEVAVVVGVLPNGTLALYDGTGVPIESTEVIPLDQVFRVELDVDGEGRALELRLYDDAEGTVPDDVVGIEDPDMGLGVSYVEFGMMSYDAILWMDELEVVAL